MNIQSREIRVGQKCKKYMPHSEVCVHMRISDKPMICEIVSNHCVQLYTLDGEKFSFPILTGEAGFFDKDWENGIFYFYPNDSQWRYVDEKKIESLEEDPMNLELPLAHTWDNKQDLVY